jgi:hypothetical protein
MGPTGEAMDKKPATLEPNELAANRMASTPSGVEKGETTIQGRSIETGGPAADLASVVSLLRTHAERLPAGEREAALEHVEKLEAHAEAEKPDTLRMKILLKGLETFGSLVPYVATAMNAIASVGA